MGTSVTFSAADTHLNEEPACMKDTMGCLVRRMAVGAVGRVSTTHRWAIKCKHNRSCDVNE